MLLATVAAVVFATGAALSVFGEHYLPAALSRPVLGGVPLMLMAWLVAAPVVAALAVAAGSLWSARRGLLDQVATLTRLAERLASGDGFTHPLPKIVDPELRTLGAAMSRLAELRDATSAMLIDRDAQLAAVRNGNGVVYWEADLAGRFCRLELPQNRRHRDWACLLGRTRWDDGAAPAELSSWDSHRATIGRLERFERLLVRRQAIDGATWYSVETGWPRFGSDGAPLGYAGTMIEVPLEEARRRDRKLALAVLGASAEPSLLVQRDASDCGWSVVDANPAACRLFGRSAAQMRERDPRTMFDAGQQDTLRALQQALADGHAMSNTANVVDAGGTARIATLRFEPARDRDVGGVGALVLDLRESEIEQLRETARIAQERQRESSSRSLDLEVTAKELESFSYSVSHDLRAPLRVVEGFARIVQEDYAHLLDRIGNDHLSRILSAAARMSSMIDALMALARLSSQPVVPQETDLSRIAEGVVDELRSAEPKRAVAVSIAPGLRVRGDTALLRSVLQNLLSNAWKYSGRRADAAISLSVVERDGQPVYMVADNGVGFDMRFADRLFGVFQRLHSAADFPGNGVGLATVQRIVRRHGGRVWAESSVGDGARFYFTLWDSPRR